MTPAHSHRVFGGVLRAPWEFPELRAAPAEATPDWTLEVADDAPPADGVVALGDEAVNPVARVTLARHARGLRLAFSDTGTFDVVDGGHMLRWHPAPHADVSAARADVVGRVLATALHLEGGLALHASAVAIGGRAFAFVAPKRHGKSTLALALVRAGARLLTDDVLPLVPGMPTWQARPGVHAMLVAEDSGRALDADGPARGGKRLFAGLPDDSIQATAVPLGGVYVLHPLVAAADGPAVRRSRLSDIVAPLALTAHARLGALLGAEAGDVLRRAAAVTADVPVWNLGITRDLGRLDEVVATLLDWHAAQAVSAP